MPQPPLPATLRAIALLLLLAATAAAQELAFAAWFSDHLVLQRSRPVPVWGWAPPGSQVTLRLEPIAETAATAGPDGRWRALLPALPAGGPYLLSASTAGARVEAADVMLGDVFLCAGQSNMDLSFDSPYADPADRRSADAPWLRLLKLGSNPSAAPVHDLRRSAAWPPGDHRLAETWRPGSAAAINAFSQVAWYFADAIHARTPGVAIGMVDLSRGGSSIKEWSSPEAQGRVSPAPVAFAADSDDDDTWHLFNGHLHPATGLACRAVLWYQGENDAIWTRPVYADWFRPFIRDVRARWGDPALPFLYVQLQSLNGNRTVEVRQAQLEALAEPATAMTVIADACAGLHPANKRPVGERLALTARALCYGEGIEHMGPIYAGAVREGARIRVSFTHAAGLRAAGAAVSRAADVDAPCEVAGADGIWHRADADLEGSQLLVQSAAVAAPVRVRYGASSQPRLTLFNAADLPASPFTSPVLDGSVTPPPPPPPPPPVPAGDSCWRFSEGAGALAADSGANGWHATLLHGAGWTPGMAGSGLLLANPNLSELRHASAGLRPLGGRRAVTVALWLRCDAAPGTAGLVSFMARSGSTYKGGWSLGLSRGRLQFSKGDPATALFQTAVSAQAPALADLAWHHAAATWSSADGIGRLYLDGALVAQGAQPGTDLGTGEAELRLGVSVINNNEFHGALDEVRILGQALEAAGVAGLMQEAAPAGGG